MTEERPAFSDDFQPPPRPIAWITWLLVGSTLAVFGLQLLSIHFLHRDVVVDYLAFYPEALHEGRYYTILSYAWVHATEMFGSWDYFWVHIAANMITLACLGPALEDLIGHWRFLFLYLGGAVAAALMFRLLNPHDLDPIIGASGAVFAVVAGVGAAAPRAQVTVLVLYIIPVRMRMSVVAIVACGLELLQMLFGWMPEVAHSAHIGGALFGFLFVMGLWLYYRQYRLPSPHPPN